jgi:hypothetical protein
MSLRKVLLAALFLLIPALAAPAPVHSPRIKLVQKLDREAQNKHLRALGYKLRGGIDKAKSDRDEAEGRHFPHFSSSFEVRGATYPFTMVGYRPQTGRAAYIRSVIIPLRMNFSGFGMKQDVSYSFDPGPAVANMASSPLYRNARYPNGVGQFGDQMQRAAFWNRMDPSHNWHVYMTEPKIGETIDIEVLPTIGELFDLGGGQFSGDVLIDFMDSQIQTILQLLDLPADVLPIFVTNAVTAQALGYHNAYPILARDGGTRLQTFIYTSWFDISLVDPLFADVSTFNHELTEWMNDPFINNIVPTWRYPHRVAGGGAECSDNPFLEVGDPQGNGSTYAEFPTAELTLARYTYHLQQVALWQWFADEAPSSAYGGWYTFPLPNELRQPAVYCQ